MKKSTTLKLIKLAVVLMAIVVAALAFRPGAGGDCCHIGIVRAQDPPDGEEGNPGHVEPKHQCSHAPAGKQVACKCREHKKCGSDGSVTESPVCRSWCFRRFCMCPDPVCP